MRTEIEERLQTLRAEFATGQQMLKDLEARQAEVRVTLTRISGAIQVLEELLAGASDPDPAERTPVAAGTEFRPAESMRP